MIIRGILAGSSSGPSIRLIRDYITEKTGKRWLIARNSDEIKNVIIRYGHAGQISGTDTEHNPREGIITLGSKWQFSKIMEAAGIPSPIYHRNNHPESFPCLIRKTLHGFGGAGIVVCPDEETFRQNYSQGDYWTIFVKTKSEVRCHCMGGKVLRIFKKVKINDEPEPELPIRHNNTHKFSLRDNRHYPELISFMEEKVLPSVNVSFGGFDVGLIGDRQFFVYEGNSAPGISQATASVYGDYLIKELGL